MSLTPEDEIADAVVREINAHSPYCYGDITALRDHGPIEDLEALATLQVVVYPTEVESTLQTRGGRTRDDITVTVQVAKQVARADTDEQKAIKFLVYEIEKRIRGELGNYRWHESARMLFEPNWFQSGVWASFVAAKYIRAGA